MIDLDTNYLIAAMLPGSSEAVRLREWRASGEKFEVSVVAWGEFLCGPLTPQAEAVARRLFPQARALEQIDAERAAHLFNATGRRSKSFADCCIAASAIRAGARLATINHDDFRHMIPLGLQLV